MDLIFTFDRRQRRCVQVSKHQPVLTLTTDHHIFATSTDFSYTGNISNSGLTQSHQHKNDHSYKLFTNRLSFFNLYFSLFSVQLENLGVLKSYLFFHYFL